MEGLVFTGISFAYFGGKRKEEGRLTTEDTESTEKEREGFQRRVRREAAEDAEKLSAPIRGSPITFCPFAFYAPA